MTTLMSILLSTLKYTDMSFWERLWDLFKTYPVLCIFGLIFCIVWILVVWFSFKDNSWKDLDGHNPMLPW